MYFGYDKEKIDTLVGRLFQKEIEVETGYGGIFLLSPLDGINEKLCYPHFLVFLSDYSHHLAVVYLFLKKEDIFLSFIFLSITSFAIIKSVFICTMRINC